MERDQFLSMACRLAIESEKMTGLPASLQVAQSAVESGWGRKAPGNNYFGIKANSIGKDSVVEILTTEYIKGVPRKMTLKFAAYHSAERSFADHTRLLTRSTAGPYTRFWLKYLEDGHLQKFVEGVCSVYATSPSYFNLVWGIMTGKRLKVAMTQARMRLNQANSAKDS